MLAAYSLRIALSVSRALPMRSATHACTSDWTHLAQLLPKAMGRGKRPFFTRWYTCARLRPTTVSTSRSRSNRSSCGVHEAGSEAPSTLASAARVALRVARAKVLVVNGAAAVRDVAIELGMAASELPVKERKDVVGIVRPLRN